MEKSFSAFSRLYQKVRKSAQKEYRLKVAKGENGYLTSLEGIINNADIISEEDLGIIEIPIKKIKGTYSRSRAHVFASNYMPLLDIESEFAIKWMELARIHITEGLRDPIKVYEYMNYYYVVEGNKRVSILKAFDAYSINGHATRLIPKRDPEDPGNTLYYEFLEFYRETKINAIWVTRTGSFRRLAEIIRDYKYDKRASNKYSDFLHGIYFPFRKEYHRLGGDAIPDITTGDAFIEYVNVYGIPYRPVSEEFTERLRGFVEELKIISDKKKVDVVAKPDEMESAGFISGLASMVAPSRRLKIAFVYPGTIKDSNWSYSHEMGRKHVVKAFGNLVQADCRENVPDDQDSCDCFVSLAKEGYDIVFATSPGYINAVLKAALEYNNTKFFCCSETRSFKNVTTYFGRIYEARFLAGIVSGIITRTDILGYVGTYPLPGTISGVNAFALGARLVNPRAKVVVQWTREWTSGGRQEEATTRLVEAGADLICHQNTLASGEFSREYGVYSAVCGTDGDKCRPGNYIAAPVWNWGIFYEKIIRQIQADIFKVSDVFRAKSVSFWWGLDSGVVDFFFSTRFLSPDTIKLVNFMKDMIAGYEYHPFTGPVYDQEGRIRIKAGEHASREMLLGMDWFVDAVETKLEKIDRKDMFGELPGLFA